MGSLPKPIQPDLFAAGLSLDVAPFAASALDVEAVCLEVGFDHQPGRVASARSRSVVLTEVMSVGQVCPAFQ